MTVFKKNCTAAKADKKEILRYALCKSEDAGVDALLEECLQECLDRLTYKVCYMELPVKHEGDMLNLTFTRTDSISLKKNLDGCSKIILFAATIGLEIDRIISKYGRIFPSKAVMFQAIGAERIEALCDAFEEELKQKYLKENFYLRPRFSPGYGDFSLEEQRAIFRILDCSRQIGLTLNESLLMSPSKSVSAIIGLADKNMQCGASCRVCGKTDCEFRRNV